MVFLRGLGTIDLWKKPEVENLWDCLFKDSRTVAHITEEEENKAKEM
jgi:hypothetical protein